MKETEALDAQQNIERIYTKLKFVKSDRTDLMVSFVSRNIKTGRICGVRQNSPYGKKVCVVDKSISPDILENTLYDCTLIPMYNKNGYVVIEATPVQFKAEVTTTYEKNCIYRAEVKFGNKTIRFDPFDGRTPSVYILKACLKTLKKRCDVADLMQVVDDFTQAGYDILTLMKQDGAVPAHKRLEK